MLILNANQFHLKIIKIVMIIYNNNVHQTDKHVFQ